MHKLIALTVFAALAAAPAALAKERNLSMIGAPAAPFAGQAWMVTIKVTIDGRAADGLGPMVRVIGAKGRTIYAASKPTSAAGIYRARVVFPTAGTWRVVALDRYSGRSYEFKRVTVRDV